MTILIPQPASATARPIGRVGRWRRFGLTPLPLLVALGILGSVLIGCKYFPESSFELARESRLPKWFNLPPGLARGDVSVTMNYYVTPWGREATFILHDGKNRRLGEVDGKLKDLQPLNSNGLPQKDFASYPFFERITANGVTEVVEHKRMEPVFYIVDSPLPGKS